MYLGYREVYLNEAPFEFIMWNRCYNHIDRPVVHSGYSINFVHRHDSKEPTQGNIYNLNNSLGKKEFLNLGGYTVTASL